MCLIINNPSGAPLSQLRMRTAMDNNRDGVGIMWHDDDGSVRVEKGLYTFDQFWKLHKILHGKPHAIHFRLRTRGKIHEDTCHPFQILNEKDDGVDLVMMHNGTLHGIPGSESESDSMIFARELRAKIRTWDNPLEILSDRLLAKLGSNIGPGNKMLFFASGGHTYIVNSKQGWFDCPKDGALEMDTHDGMETPVWYSNQYSFSGLDPDTWYTTPLPPKPEIKASKKNDTEVKDIPPSDTVKTVITASREAAPGKSVVVVRRTKGGESKPLLYR